MGDIVLMYIGICDDIREERQMVFNLCEEYFRQNAVDHDYIFFSSGEAVLAYCEKNESGRIDVLFLDVEMSGMSGIELKEAVMRQDKIWRIVFVTNHNESIFGAFGRKTIGFLPKPPVQESVHKMLDITLNEMEENAVVIIKGFDGKVIEILLEEIAYFKASGSYTEIVTYTPLGGSDNYILISRKIGDLEKEMMPYHIIRVHRSYMVNLANVIDVGEKIILRKLSQEIPVGRVYKEKVRKSYLQYGRNRIKKRL